MKQMVNHGLDCQLKSQRRKEGGGPAGDAVGGPVAAVATLGGHAFVAFEVGGEFWDGLVRGFEVRLGGLRPGVWERLRMGGGWGGVPCVPKVMQKAMVGYGRIRRSSERGGAGGGRRMSLD